MMFPFKAPFVPDFSNLDYSMNGIWSSAVWVKDFWTKRATVSLVDPANDGVGYDLQTTGCYLSWLNIELYQIRRPRQMQGGARQGIRQAARVAAAASPALAVRAAAPANEQQPVASSTQAAAAVNIGLDWIGDF